MEQNLSPRAPHVLVVDDDPLVRNLIVCILAQSGFDAFEAGCADEALRDIEQCPRIDAVVTDIDMPGELDGIGLARRIGELWPEIGVIVTSGGSRSTSSLPRAVRFLAKPFTASRLLRSIAELVGDNLPLYAAS
jgi:two-component system, response regulator PdtaR